MNELVLFNTALTGRSVAGLFDPAAPNADDVMTGLERRMISALMSSDERVDVAIPEDIEGPALWTTLELCCRVFVRARWATSQLKLLIGRALVLGKDQPSFYEGRGYRSFDAFMSDDVNGLPKITGISRSELYKAKTVAEAAPTLSMADAREIGFSKLALVAAVSKEGNADFGMWVAAAKKDTIPQLRDRIYKSNMQIPDGSLEWDVFSMDVTKDEKTEIMGFLESPEARAYCETNRQGPILIRMIAECRTEWSCEGAARILQGEVLTT